MSTAASKPDTEAMVFATIGELIDYCKTADKRSRKAYRVRVADTVHYVFATSNQAAIVAAIKQTTDVGCRPVSADDLLAAMA